MSDTSRDAVERIRKYVNHTYTTPDTIILDSDLVTINAGHLAALLAAKEAAEAERDDLRCQLSKANQNLGRCEALTDAAMTRALAAEAEATALRGRLDVAKGALQQMVGGKMYYGDDGFSMPHEPETSILARKTLALIEKDKTDE